MSLRWPVATTTKRELIDRIAEKTGTKHMLVKTVVHYFLDEIIAELGKGGRLEFKDFASYPSDSATPDCSALPWNGLRRHRCGPRR
jgi:hypothetical protein